MKKYEGFNPYFTNKYLPAFPGIKVYTNYLPWLNGYEILAIQGVKYTSRSIAMSHLESCYPDEGEQIQFELDKLVQTLQYANP